STPPTGSPPAAPHLSLPGVSGPAPEWGLSELTSTLGSRPQAGLRQDYSWTDGRCLARPGSLASSRRLVVAGFRSPHDRRRGHWASSATGRRHPDGGRSCAAGVRPEPDRSGRAVLAGGGLDPP